MIYIYIYYIDVAIQPTIYLYLYICIWNDASTWRYSYRCIHPSITPPTHHQCSDRSILRSIDLYVYKCMSIPLGVRSTTHLSVYIYIYRGIAFSTSIPSYIYIHSHVNTYINVSIHRCVHAYAPRPMFMYI